MIENIKLFLVKYLHWLCLIPIMIYFFVFQKYAINIPHWDDYALIKFCNAFWSDINFQEKFNLIFKQHNEHRIAITRVVSLLINVINGHLDFKWLMWVGNISLVVVFYIFYKVIIDLKLPKITLLIPSLLIFQLSHFENTIWGMAAVQNFGVVLFMLLAIRQLTLNKIPYIFTFLAVFTSGNAILLLPILGFIAFIICKEHKKMFIYLAFCIFLSLVYFVGYQNPPDVKPIDLTTPFLNIKAGIVYIGSVFDFNQGYDLSKRIFLTLLFGSIMLIAFLFYCYQYVLKSYIFKVKIKPSVLFLVLIVLMLIGTGLLAGITRIQYGFYVFLVSRYRIYSILGLVSFSILSIYFINQKYKQYLIFSWLALTTFLYLTTYFNSILAIKQYRKNEIANYYNSWHINENVIENGKNNCFKYVNTFLDNIPTDTLNGEILKSSKIEILNEEIFVGNNNFEIGNGIDDGAYLLFKADSNQYIYATNQKYHNSIKRIIKGESKYVGGFDAKLPLNELASGDYFIDILNKHGDSLKLIKTNYYLEINSKKQRNKIQNW